MQNLLIHACTHIVNVVTKKEWKMEGGKKYGKIMKISNFLIQCGWKSFPGEGNVGVE